MRTLASNSMRCGVKETDLKLLTVTAGGVETMGSWLAQLTRSPASMRRTRKTPIAS